jgi:dihydroorotate dehydrogenase
LDNKNLKKGTIGVSVGSSNIPEVNTIEKAIDDYLFTFKLFSKKTYVKYFELNISCPNTAMPTPFTDPGNFMLLTNAISKLKLKQPIFVKMPNELSTTETDKLVQIAIDHKIYGFIFSNLVKDRKNSAFDPKEIAQLANQKGNFSGRPTFANSNKLIAHVRNKFGKNVAIIGCGGVFSAKDAKAKIDAGADLVQLITGMIFEGPQLIGQINKQLLD